jgi:hypothetical protein
VAAQDLKRWGGGKVLEEKIPIYVEKICSWRRISHDRRVYDELVKALLDERVGRLPRGRGQEHRHFSFLEGRICISCGKYGGHAVKDFGSIEFVDHEKQPNYTPPRRRNSSFRPITNFGEYDVLRVDPF